MDLKVNVVVDALQETIISCGFSLKTTAILA